MEMDVAGDVIHALEEKGPDPHVHVLLPVGAHGLEQDGELGDFTQIIYLTTFSSGFFF